MNFYITGILLVSTRVQLVASDATLTLPTSVNCGDPAVLTCTSSGCGSGYRFARNNVTVYNKTGPAPTISDPDRYSANVTSDTQVQLTITNIQYSDAVEYACTCGFNLLSTGQTLVYQCKASTSSASVTSDKKVSITVDRLYPEPSSIVTTNTTNTLQGAHMCRSSSTLALHFMCSWNSNTSFPDGIHNYTITVTTGTQAAPVSGSFRILTPTSPNISNLVTISNNRQVLRGVPDTPLTIQCVSKGGIPAPTLAWYLGEQLAQSNISDSVQMPDGTYKVNLTYRFTPSRTDDLRALFCRLFYPGATSGASPDPLPAFASLYLDLIPDKPALSQTGEAVSGGSLALRCTSANGRPAPNITWSYRGQTFTPTNTQSLDPITDTYTVESVLQRPVSAVDNGQTATCEVSHTTHSLPRTGTIGVDIKFGPSAGSTTIYGNQTTAAAGITQIRLNCTSGSSNPASNITWYNGSEVIPNTEGYTRWPGNNNGVVTSNILTITPTRNIDRDRITCRSDNGYGSDSTYYVSLDILGPPSTPTITNLSFVAGQVKLTVVPGYHGGLNQTIVVQTSTDHKTWHNSSSVNVGKVLSHTTLEISNLQPNNLHYVRAYAFNSEGQSQNYSAVLNVAVKQDESSYCSSISATLAVSVSTTAFITIILCIVVLVIVLRRYPNLIMQIPQHTCPGNVPNGNETKTVMQSQTSTGLEREMVFSTLVVAENPTGGENVEATPAYESLNQTRDQSVYTSLEATENPTRGENVEATPTYVSLDQTRIKSVDTSLEATENPTRGENVEATPAYESLD